MKLEELLSYWHGCLLQPDNVRVFEWRDDIYWTDKFGFARVPEPLKDEVVPGRFHTVTSHEIEVGAPAGEGNTYEVLDRLEKKSRLIVVDTGETMRMDVNDRGEIKKDLEVREFKTKSKGEIIPVRLELHPIIDSTIRRGAELYTESGRKFVSSKIEGSLVASVAAILPNKPL